jgi:hypothetical protein
VTLALDDTPAGSAERHRLAIERRGEAVYVRRYSGTGGSRTHVDTQSKGRVTGYAPHEIVGSIQGGDRKVIVLAASLASILPVTPADRLVVRGRELSIIAVDDNTRRVAGTLVALELQVRG